MTLKGKVAIITGGAQGLGKAYAFRLAEEGARIVVADILAEQAAATAVEIRAGGGEAIGIRVDVADEASVEGMARQTIDAYGRIDVLVNNAALFVALLPKKKFHQVTVEEWDRTMAVNVKGIFLCCKAVVPHMKAQGKGKIINISSGAALCGSWDFILYVTSKAAVIGLTRALAREVGDDNINVNAVAPGMTLSEGVAKTYAPETLENWAQRRCFKRLQRPDDLVGTIAFLASDDSDFITGQTISVDGGDQML